MSDRPNQSPLPSKRKRWISLPPVYQTTYQKFVVEGDGWPKLKANAKNHYDANGSKVEKATVERLIGELEASLNKARLYLVYHFIWPRGVASVDTREAKGYVTICYLLGDGSEWGIGMTLIESAATLSQQLGNDGKLRLIPDNDELIAYYTKLGFKITEEATMYSGPVMTLTPASPEWSCLNGEWRLALNDPHATWR
jgi:hypothetical protein